MTCSTTYSQIAKSTQIKTRKRKTDQSYNKVAHNEALISPNGRNFNSLASTYCLPPSEESHDEFNQESRIARDDSKILNDIVNMAHTLNNFYRKYVLQFIGRLINKPGTSAGTLTHKKKLKTQPSKKKQIDF